MNLWMNFFSKALALVASFAFFLVANPSFAQSTGTVPQIGLLHLGNVSKSTGMIALLQGLRELGYVEGKNIKILRRSAQGKRQKLKELAAELIQQKVAVIAAPGSAVGAAIKLTKSIPIVVTVADDFIERGWAKNLERPGKNITGFSNAATISVGKQLQLLKEIAPNLSRAGIIFLAGSPSHQRQMKEAEKAARALKVKISGFPIKAAKDLPAAFGTMKEQNVNGVFVFRSGVLVRMRKEIANFALNAKLPSIFAHVPEARAGGLMAYGANTVAIHKRAASYVDKIIKGAKPAEMPILNPKEFHLAINLQTAKSIGIEVPPSLLQRATEVIK